MPGPIKRPTPDSEDVAELVRGDPLVGRVQSAGPIPELPSAIPFQSTRPFKVAVTGGVIEIIETYWTKRNLLKWLKLCPKVWVNVAFPVGADPNDAETTKDLQVFYDGYRFDVPKGEPVQVPAPIAAIVRQSQEKFPTAQSKGLDLYSITTRNPNGRRIDVGLDGSADPDDDDSQE